jgi:transcription initiation factor TFIIIB Brf1 subunit/transcription initiation factor TFIIB
MKTKLLKTNGKCPNCHRQTLVKDTVFGDQVCVSCAWWSGDHRKSPDTNLAYKATKLNMDKLNKIQADMGKAMANKIWGSKQALKFVHKIYGINEVLQ